MAIITQTNPKILEAQRLVRKLASASNYNSTTGPTMEQDSQTLEVLQSEIRAELQTRISQEKIKPVEVKKMPVETTDLKSAKKNLGTQYNELITTYRAQIADIRATVAKKKQMRADRNKLSEMAKKPALSPADEAFVRQYL